MSLELTPHNKMRRCILKFSMEEPFFATLMSRMHYVEFEQEVGDQLKEMHGFLSMATDGKKVYYDPEFVMDITGPGKNGVPGLTFILAHEIMHTVYEHFGDRRDGRNPILWNYAGDYVINGELIEMRSECLGGGSLPLYKGNPTGLYDAKYNGMTTEKVYRLLENQFKKEMQKQGGGQGGGQGKGGGVKSVAMNGDGSATITHNDGSKTEMSADDVREAMEKMHGKNFDVHKESSNGKEDPHPENGQSTEEKDQIRREITAAVKDAVNAAEQFNEGKGAGNVPGNIARIIREMNEPRIDWREIFVAKMKGFIKNDHTYMRINRRSVMQPYILPGQDYDDEVEAVIAIDNSGSISERNLREFLSEVYGMMSQFQQIKLTLFAFDDVVDERNVFVFDKFDIEELKSVQFVGGGGTSFTCIFDYMKKNAMEPKVLLIATDGYPYGSWGDPDYCEDTIFLICDDKDHKIKAPFGQTVWYEDEH